MATPENARRIGDLRLDTEFEVGGDEDGIYGSDHRSPNMLARSSAASQETVRATPPMNIPITTENVIAGSLDFDDSPAEPSVERYLRNRQPSVSFNHEITLESGQRQSINVPLEKARKPRPRGRSLLQAISDEKNKAARAHSESDRSHFDPETGRHLPKYATTPPDLAQLGEGRFPLLQSTVDEMARELQPDLNHALSLTSQSTVSPTSEHVHTPRDEQPDFIFSPNCLSSTRHASSFEEPKSFRRTASQRWRDGQAASDFFTKASLRNSSGDSRRAARRHDSGSVKTPKSAASSFLRAFSMSSGEDENERPLACDDEGQTIGDNYVLGKQIGYGGFSVIKEVTHLQDEGHQRKLAVKIVRRNIDGKSEVENEHVQAEFEHEVELWRFLNHPRILPLEAVYKTDEATFCFIPLNTGGTLFDLIRHHRQGLPMDSAKRYTYQLASALRYLHGDARVVHRDIKLENILIDNSSSESGDIRICDFGMAEWISNDNATDPPSPRINATDRPPQKNIGPADTSTSAFAGGSLEYAAPEILKVAECCQDGKSERALVSPAVDIWALGVCIYSMVVGSRPFSNSFQPRVVMAILAGDWDRKRLLSKGGQDVLDLVEGCLEMDEQDRWRIGEVLDSAWLSEVAKANDNDDERSNGWRQD